MEDIAYTDGYAAQYGDNYAYDGYGYGGDLAVGDYNPYGTDYGYDAEGYDYGAGYGGYGNQETGYGDQTYGYGEPAEQPQDSLSLKLDEPKPFTEQDDRKSLVVRTDAASVSMDPFGAPIDTVTEPIGSQTHTSSAFPPVSQDLLNSIRVQQETSGNLSKSPSKISSRPASARLDELDKVIEEDAEQLNREAKTDTHVTGAAPDTSDMFGFTDQPAAPTATEEPVATAGDDMFGFGLESDARDATVQPPVEDAGPALPDKEAPSTEAEDDMFGFATSPQETMASPPADSTAPAAEPVDDMFGFTDPAVESAATAEPGTMEGDDMFGFGPSESTPKDPDTDASAVAKDVTVDAQDAADDMFGFDGAGSPAEAPAQSTEAVASPVADLETDSMFGFDSPPAPADNTTTVPVDDSADDLFGFGPSTLDAQGEPAQDAQLDIQDVAQVSADSMFGFDLPADASATVEPSTTGLATEKPEDSPVDDMFGFSPNEAAATAKSDADQEITPVNTKTLDEPLSVANDCTQPTAGPSDDMFGFGNSADLPQTDSVPHSEATADSMFGFDSVPATGASVEPPSEKPKLHDASQTQPTLDMPTIPEHIPTIEDNQTDLSHESQNESQVAGEEPNQLRETNETLEGEEMNKELAQEPAAEDMFGFGDASAPVEDSSTENATESHPTKPPNLADLPPPVSASSLLLVQTLESAKQSARAATTPVADMAIDIDSMISAALVPRQPSPAPEQKVEDQVLDEPSPNVITAELPPIVVEGSLEEANDKSAAESQHEPVEFSEDRDLSKDIELVAQDPLPAEEDTQDIFVEQAVPVEALERLAISETFIKLQEELQFTYLMPEPNREELDKLQVTDHEQQLIQLKDEAERLQKENKVLAGRSAAPRHLHPNEFDSKSISVSFFEGLLNEPTHSDGISLTTGEELRLLAILEQGDYEALDALHGMSPEELQLMEQREREFNLKLKELTDRRDELLYKDDTEALKLIEEEIWAFVDAEEEKKMRIQAADDLLKKRAQEEEDRRRAEIEAKIKEEQDRVAEERRLQEEMIALQKKQQQEYAEQETRKADLLREAMEKEQLERIEEEQRIKAEARRRLIDDLEATAERAAAEDRIRVKAELEEMARIKKELEEAARTASEEKRKLLLQQKEQLEREMAETARRHEEDVARRHKELQTLHEERRRMREQRLASSEPMDELLYEDGNDASTDPFSYASLDIERRIREMKAQLEKEMTEKMALEHADLNALEQELAAKKLSTLQAERLLSTAASDTVARLDNEDRLFNEAMDAKRQELLLLKEQYGLVRHQNESQRALHLEEQRKAKKLARLVEQVAELAEKKHNLERKIAHRNKEFHKKESKLVASNSKGALKALRKEHAKEHEALETQLSSISEQLRKAKKQLKVLNPQGETSDMDRSLSVKDYLRSTDRSEKEQQVSAANKDHSQPRLSVFEGGSLGQPSLVSGHGIGTAMSTGVDHGDGGRKQHASSDLPVALQKLREEHARRLEKIEQRRAAFASEREQLQAQAHALEAQLSKPVNVPDSKLRTREQCKQIIFAEMNRMEKLSKAHMVEVKPQIPEKTIDDILNERRKRHGEEREQLKNMAVRFTSAYDRHSRVSVNMDSSDDEWNDLAARTPSRYADISTKPRSMQAQVRQFASDRIDPAFNSYIEAPVRPGYESSLLSYVKVSSDPTTCHPTKFVARLTAHTWCIEQKSKPYVVYTFTISTEKGVFEVAKRFSELRELDKALRRVFPTVTLPKYPSSMGGKFTDEQLEERKRLLGRYMSQLNQIAVIRTSQVYKEFIQMKVRHDILVYHR